MSGEKVKESSIARRGRRRPVGVVGGVEHDGGAAPDDLQPAGRGDLGEGRAHQVRVERLLAGEGLDGRQRHGGVLRLVGAVQRQEDVVVPAAQALEREHLPADGGHPRHDAELHALTGDGGADLGGALDQQVATSASCWASTAMEPGLMIPAFSWAIAVGESPRYFAWSTEIGQHDRDVGVDDVGGVPGPAHADLDDGDAISYRLVVSPGHGVVGHHPSPPRRVPIGRLPVAGFGIAAGHLFLQH